MRAAQISSDSGITTHKFTGYERDPETGLDYAFARYYSSRLGRFLSTDPLGGAIGDLQSHNAYAYTENNPLNFTDSSGMREDMPGQCPQVSIDGVSASTSWDGGCSFGRMLYAALGIIDEFDILTTPIGFVPNPECPFPDDCPAGVSPTLPVYGSWGLLSPFGGPGGGSCSDWVCHALQISALKFQLAQLFKANKACADLLGGLSSAMDLLNKQNFQDTTAPGWNPPQNVPQSIQQGIQDVQAGANTAYTAWPTPSPKSEVWTGQRFQTFVAQPFFGLGLAAMETVNIHELSHPHLGNSNDNALPSDQSIIDKCGTAVVN